MVFLGVADKVTRTGDVNRYCVLINSLIRNNRLNHIGLCVCPTTCLRGQCGCYRRIKSHCRKWSSLIHRLIEGEGYRQCRCIIRICNDCIANCRSTSCGRIHRVYSLKVVSNLNQRVASNINNAVIHSDRDIVRAAISNCHSDSRCIGVRWVSN